MGKQMLSLLLIFAWAVSLSACGSTGSAPGETSLVTEDIGVHQTSAPPTKPAFPETVFVDDSNCTFKVTAIDEDSTFGYILRVFLENKTDKKLVFSVDRVSVNGFMCDPFWAATVAAGMKANEEISFSRTDFDTNGIQKVTQIEFTLRVYDSDNWDADPIILDAFSLYPHGEDAVENYTRVPQEGEIILFDNENCAMIVTGSGADSIWGYTLTVYLENKTDKDLMFSIDGASVNGFMCDPLWAASVAAGKRSTTRIAWSKTVLEENNITDVTGIVLPVRVYDENDWTADYLIDQAFPFSPPNH